MMENAYFHAVEVGVLACALAACGLWHERERRQERNRSGNRLYFTSMIKIFGWFGLIFANSMAILILFAEEPIVRWIGFLASLFLGVGSHFLLQEYYRTSHKLSDSDIHYTGFWQGKIVVPWLDIHSVQYSESMKWIQVQTSSFQILRFHIMLIGVELLASCLLEKAQNATMDDKTNEVLKNIKKGLIPQIF